MKYMWSDWDSFLLFSFVQRVAERASHCPQYRLRRWERCRWHGWQWVLAAASDQTIPMPHQAARCGQIHQWVLWKWLHLEQFLREPSAQKHGEPDPSRLFSHTRWWEQNNSQHSASSWHLPCDETIFQLQGKRGNERWQKCIAWELEQNEQQRNQTLREEARKKRDGEDKDKADAQTKHKHKRQIEQTQKRKERKSKF